jgi:hypothetical protein
MKNEKKLQGESNPHFSQSSGECGVGGALWARACRVRTLANTFGWLQRRVHMIVNAARTSAYATVASEALIQIGAVRYAG